ncbi:hypothetical protein QPK87_15020 [Kamptonema cortianum]|nr:hypothetical protein [Kamptonema cortianum]
MSRGTKKVAAVASKRIRDLKKVIRNAEKEIKKIIGKFGLSDSAAKAAGISGKRKYKRVSADDILKLIASGTNSYEGLLAKTGVSRATLHKHLKSVSKKIEINNKVRPAIITAK